MVIAGANCVNNHPGTHTVPEVFVPLDIRVEFTGALWWITDSGEIERIRAHIADCDQATVDEMNKVANDLIRKSAKYGHVLNRLGDLFTLRPATPMLGGEYRMIDMADGKITAPPPKEIKLGRKNTMSTIAIQELGLRGDYEVGGNGFKLSVPKAVNGKAKIDVTFLTRQPPKQ